MSDENPDDDQTRTAEMEQAALSIGLRKRTAFVVPDAVSPSARRQRAYRDRMLEKELRPLSVFAPTEDRPRAAVRAVAARMRDDAFVRATETLIEDPAAVSILTSSALKIARSLIEPANDNFSTVTERAIADPILRDHLTRVAEQDAATRSTFLDAMADPILLEAIARGSGRANFRRALETLLADDGLVDAIATSPDEVRRLAAASSSVDLKTIIDAASFDPDVAATMAAFSSLAPDLRESAILTATEAPRLSRQLLRSPALRRGLMPAILDPSRQAILKRAMRAADAEVAFLVEVLPIAADPSRHAGARHFLDMAPDDLAALANIDAASLLEFVEAQEQAGADLKAANAQLVDVLHLASRLDANTLTKVVGLAQRLQNDRAFREAVDKLGAHQSRNEAGGADSASRKRRWFRWLPWFGD